MNDVSLTREPSWVLLAVIAVCPFIAMSDTVVDALGIGVAIIAMVLISSSVMAAIGTLVPQDARWIAAVFITSSTAAAIALGFDAWVHSLHDRLHIFLAMLVCNPVLLADLGSSKQRPAHLIGRSMIRGLLAAWILIGLSIGRELVGRGSLLHDSTRLFGRKHVFEFIAFPSDMGFLLAMLAPGAFFAIGIAFALYQRLARDKKE
jgi:H+/Na+-translocating ferredoxin:NAD+ oxidoreductase subunit E